MFSNLRPVQSGIALLIAVFFLLVGALVVGSTLGWARNGAPSSAMVAVVASAPLDTPSPTTCPLSWGIVPSPNPGGSSGTFPAAVTGSGNDVWAVGSYGSLGSQQTLTLHWNGSAWSQVTSPSPGGDDSLSTVTGSGNDVWAVGGSGNDTLTLHWNGSAWSQVMSPSPSGF